MPKYKPSAFTQALKAKKREGKFSIRSLAKEIGVGVQSATMALKGSTPNASTMGKYVAFLGVTVDQAKAMVTQTTAPKATKPAKASRRAKAARPSTTTAGPVIKNVAQYTLGEVTAILADPIVMAIYRLPPNKRQIVKTIVEQLAI